MTTIETLKLNREKALTPYYEIQKDRIRRYFDCQDDTILGGISDIVTNETISKINKKFDLLIEEESNGGFLLRTEEKVCLYRDGVMVSDRLCNGKYGKFFALNDGTFISVAKKKATFDKKGVEVKILTTNYKCNFKEISKSGNIIYKNIEVIETTKRDFNFSKDTFINNNWLEYLLNN